MSKFQGKIDLIDLIEKISKPFTKEFIKDEEPTMLQEYVEFMMEQFLKHMPVETAKFIRENCYLAGGCFRSIILKKPVKDWDFYFKTEEAKNQFIKLIDGNSWQTPALGNNYYIADNTDNAITCQFQKSQEILQFITRWTGSPDKVVEKFDFLHTQSYYVLDTKLLKITKTPYKELKYNTKSPYPINALKRALKFAKEKGVEMEDESLIDICLAIKGLDLYDDKVLEEQLHGLYIDKTKMKTKIKQAHDNSFSKKVNRLVEE